MNMHLKKDMDKLKVQMLSLAGRVEENVRKAVKALRELSMPLADDVIKNDKLIDESEVAIEEECLKILALHQPVASDLRFVITVLKINNELEHIGDMAANIAKRVVYLKCENKVTIPFNLEAMATRTVYMLKSSLDAFISSDEILALGVCNDDDLVDEENKKCYVNLGILIKSDSNNAMSYINYLMACRSLERIADLCTNIAEDVIYMKRSIIVRHNLKEAEKYLKQNDEF